MKHTKKYLIGLATAAVLPTCLALAHSGATGIVKERMDSMKAIAGGMKTIGQMIRQPDTFDRAKALAAIAVVQDQAKRTPELYPEGSIMHPSEALPAIWENPDRFAELKAAMESAAQTLEAEISSVEKVDALIEPFKAVGQTCANCHSEFRLKK